MSLAIGTQLGPYEILAPIGAGGMGEVWKARDTRLNRVVAIKISKKQFSERFEREARAVAALNHPYVCQLYDVGPNYLVMELVEGAALKGPLPLEKAVEYAGQILEALDAAHRKGITHRDLKPENILVTKQGIKLLDFGLAKQSGLKETDGTLTAALTGQGQILGTLQYMSPEQLNGKETDTRSDLFSFGCVLYEMITGRRAFEGQSAASVIAAILEREPAPLEEAPPLSRVVRRSLAKDPDQRFQTARDLKAALTWALEQPPAAQSRPDRRNWIGIAAATLVVGAAAGFTVARFRESAPDERVLRLLINPPIGGQFVIGGGLGASVALSPDGKNAAFVATTSGKNGLWVRPLNRTEARLIPGTEGALYPFWSPDGTSIAFYTTLFKMMRVDLAGGTPLVICEGTPVRGAAWATDGQVIFGSLGNGLRRVPDTGGTPSPLTTLDESAGEVAHYWPQALPGSRFLFFVQSTKPEKTGIYAASLTKPSERIHLLTTDAMALYASGAEGRNYLVWQRGGTLLAQEINAVDLRLKGEVRTVADRVAMSPLGQINVAVAGGLLLYSDASPVSQLTWFDRSGNRVGTVGEPGEFASFRISPEGRRIAAMRERPGGTDLWLLDADRGVSNRLTSTPGFKSIPVWSPDGRSIVFASGGAPFNLVRKATTGGGDEQRLIQSSRHQVPNDWSRGGRFLLYYEVASSRGLHMWTLPMPPDGTAPSAKPRPYGLGTQFNETLGRFSPEPDPRWVAYHSDESGRFEVYVDAFPEPRNKVMISIGGGRFPEWSPDGRELFYVSPDQKLMAVNLKAGTESLEASPPRELFTLPSAENARNPYDVALDGRRFLVRAVPENQAAQPLTLIVNWSALLKMGAAAQ